MTNEELKTDCGKFIDYLCANGERTLSFAIYTEQGKILFGNQEMLNEMAVSLLAHGLGLTVTPNLRKSMPDLISPTQLEQFSPILRRATR